MRGNVSNLTKLVKISLIPDYRVICSDSFNLLSKVNLVLKLNNRKANKSEPIRKVLDTHIIKHKISSIKPDIAINRELRFAKFAGIERWLDDAYNKAESFFFDRRVMATTSINDSLKSIKEITPHIQKLVYNLPNKTKNKTSYLRNIRKASILTKSTKNLQYYEKRAMTTILLRNRFLISRIKVNRLEIRFSSEHNILPYTKEEIIKGLEKISQYISMNKDIDISILAKCLRLSIRYHFALPQVHKIFIDNLYNNLFCNNKSNDIERKQNFKNVSYNKINEISVKPINLKEIGIDILLHYPNLTRIEATILSKSLGVSNEYDILHYINPSRMLIHLKHTKLKTITDVARMSDINAIHPNALASVISRLFLKKNFFNNKPTESVLQTLLHLWASGFNQLYLNTLIPESQLNENIPINELQISSIQKKIINIYEENITNKEYKFTDFISKSNILKLDNKNLKNTNINNSHISPISKLSPFRISRRKYKILKNKNNTFISIFSNIKKISLNSNLIPSKNSTYIINPTLKVNKVIKENISDNIISSIANIHFDFLQTQIAVLCAFSYLGIRDLTPILMTEKLIASSLNETFYYSQLVKKNISNKGDWKEPILGGLEYQKNKLIILLEHLALLYYNFDYRSPYMIPVIYKIIESEKLNFEQMEKFIKIASYLNVNCPTLIKNLKLRWPASFINIVDKPWLLQGNSNVLIGSKLNVKQQRALLKSNRLRYDTNI